MSAHVFGGLSLVLMACALMGGTVSHYGLEMPIIAKGIYCMFALLWFFGMFMMISGAVK